MTTNADAFVEALQAEEDRLLGLLGALRDLLAFYGANRSEEITRQPRQAKALRAAKAEKEIRPKPQEPADIEQDEAAERILPPAALVPVEMPDLTKPAPRERVDAVATSPGPVEKSPADRHDGTDGGEPAKRRGPRTVDAGEAAHREAIVRELYPDASISTAEIGRRAGMAQSQVSAYAKRLGLPPRGRPGRSAPNEDDGDDHDGHTPDHDATPAAPPPIVRQSSGDANGHVFTLHGVSLTHEAVSFNGKEMPITESQYRLLHALLRAAPHPIGVPHLLAKVYPGKAKTEAEVVFGIVVKDMERNLPMVDLSLKSMKGIGVALSGSDAG